MPASSIVPYPFSFIPAAASNTLPPMDPLFSSSCDYVSKRNSGNVTMVLNPVEYTEETQEERHPSFGVYTRLLVGINIPAVLLNGYVPKPGDSFTLTATSGTYNVISRGTVDLDCLRVVGFDPILSYQLTDSINILPPVDSTDAYLSPLTTPGSSSDLNNLSARIQFLREVTEDFQGVQYMRPWYNIYVQNLAKNLAIGTTVTVNTGEYTGTIFRVVSNDNIEQLEELEMLTVTVDP